MSKPQTMQWDWREQPDLAELARIVAEMSGGAVHITAVDTGSDDYAIVVADRPLTEAEAYDAWTNQEDD